VPILETKEDGSLLCAECAPSECEGVRWCEHLEDWIKAHKDAEYFWNTVSLDQHKRWWPAVVPVFPTQGLHANVKVARPNSQAPWELFLILDDEDALVVGDRRYPLRLGITGPGEGRIVWRGMILDAWRAQFDGQVKCPSKGHSFAAQGVLSRVMAQGNKQEINATLFSIWYNELCLWCYNKTGAILSDDDLIPQVGNKDSWASLTGKPRGRK
jgi:hypothetical protein